MLIPGMTESSMTSDFGHCYEQFFEQKNLVAHSTRTVGGLRFMVGKPFRVWLTFLTVVLVVPRAGRDDTAAANERTMGVSLSAAHLAAVNRQRRIYVNNDAGYDAVVMGPKESRLSPDEWIAARFSVFSQSGSQVDCVGWCLDEGNIAAYPSKVIPELQYPTLLRWRKDGVDIAQRIVEESHRCRIEVFWEHRLNGADREADVSTPAQHPLKTQHPDWLIKDSWWKPGLWNYAVPEVRQFKLSVLREVAKGYDLDGLNLDFGRHPPYFPTGEQWEHRDEMTDFVRQVRLMLQEVAQKRGRPFLLSVRVADTVPGCHFDGLDIENWVRLKLVDMIVIGTRSIEVDLAGFKEVVQGSHVKLYPCIDQHHSPDGYHAVPAVEFVRGVAANWWHQGADGIATFNFWNELPEMAKVIGTRGPLNNGQSVHAQAYREIGDPATLRLLNKWFVVSRRYGGGFFNRQGNRWNDYLNLNHQLQLPLKMTADPAWVELNVADSVAERREQIERLELRLLVSGSPKPNELADKLNGINLRQPTINADCWTWKLAPGMLALGRNLVAVDTSQRDRSITLEKVEIHVHYSKKQVSR